MFEDKKSYFFRSNHWCKILEKKRFDLEERKWRIRVKMEEEEEGEFSQKIN
jgi:hypothetical protein